MPSSRARRLRYVIVTRGYAVGYPSFSNNTCVVQNDQIDVALNSFLASPALSKPSEKLSSEGKSLVADVRDVVTQAKKLLLSKNEGNLLQDFIWQTQEFDPKAVGTPNAPVNKETAKQHGDKALQGLRTLGTLIITNGQFRKLCKLEHVQMSMVQNGSFGWTDIGNQ